MLLSHWLYNYLINNTVSNTDNSPTTPSVDVSTKDLSTSVQKPQVGVEPITSKHMTVNGVGGGVGGGAETDNHGSVTHNSAVDVESAYQQAAEFIESMELLKGAPDGVGELFERLTDSHSQLQESIESLQRHALEVKTYTHQPINT